MDEMQEKQDLSMTGEGMSRENSLSSLPETECEWDPSDNAMRREAPQIAVGEASFAEPDNSQVFESPPRWPSASQHFESQPDASAAWAQCIPPAPPLPPVLDYIGSGGEVCPHQLAPTTCYFQVTYLGGIEVRASPDHDAPRTGLVLMQNEIFAVSHHYPCADGRVYLALADGQGWVFDDSALVPHDPSVVQLPYAAPQQVPSVAPPWPGVEQLMLPPPLPLPGPDTFVPEAYAPQCLLPPPPPPPLHAAPSGELLSSGPVVSWFRVSYLGGLNTRCAPSMEAPLTGFTLPQMETFPVSEEVPGADGRMYLLLADGRGWAFDDSALMPLDPSVKRGNWMNPQATTHIVATRVLQEVQADALPIRRRMHPQPRGKRGGKRCTRRAQNSSAATSVSTGAGAEG